MAKIDKRLVNKIRAELLRINAQSGDVHSFNTEFQDEGLFLLIGLEIRPDLSDRDYDAYADQLKTRVTHVLPQEEENYSWMAVITVDGEPIRSVMAELVVSGQKPT